MDFYANDNPHGNSNNKDMVTQTTKKCMSGFCLCGHISWEYEAEDP